MENSEKHVLQLIKSIFEGIKHPFFFFFFKWLNSESPGMNVLKNKTTRLVL